MAQQRTKKLISGQLIVELLLAFGLSSILLPALVTGFGSAVGGREVYEQRLQATGLLREGQEAIRSFRDESWQNIANLNPANTYYPEISGTKWTLINGTSPLINGFTRSVAVSDVYRNTNKDIVAQGTSGATLDPSTRKFQITVSWSGLIQRSVSSTMYLTRYLRNSFWRQTTKADFDAGTKNGVITTNTAGGEIQLAAGGKADWCEPNLSIVALDLPKNGVANAISAVPGTVVAGTGENSSGISFANIAVTDTDPPTSQILGTFDGYKTNGVFNDSNYAYIATDNHSKEMIILDLNQLDPDTKKYAEVGYFNAPGNNNGTSISVSGNIGFLTVNNILYSINLSSKSGSRPQLASRSLAANGSKVVVNGNYAFVSIAGATQELQIVQFNAAGTTLTITGSADVNGQAAYDVSVNSSGTRAYLATGADSSRAEFFIIDTSSKNGNRPTVGSYDAAGMDPNAVAVVSSNKAVLVGTGGEEYQVINIADEAHPTHCGGLNINTGINGLASVTELDGDAYTYIITGDSSSELKIIEGGPGGKYVASGSFESSTFDLGSEVAYNGFSANIIAPNQTTFGIQFAGADPVNGSCNGVAFNYVGPDATSLTKYATSNGTIVLDNNGAGYENPARCMRYKIFLDSSDAFATPVVNDVTINYSP